MTHATTRSIVILFLVLGIKMLTESMGINNYFQLINDVHRYYRTSCVIFVRSDNYDLNTTTLVHTWSREFSRHRVMTVTITFSDLTSEYNEYWKNVAQPLFVVLLDTEETMGEFAETTRSIKPISFPIWLVMFLQRPGNPLEKRCRHPTDNVFNVDFGTQMLVFCYARPILVEWYAIRDNRTRTFDLALWSPDRGLLLRTRKSLYARRSDMFGDVVRVTFVNNSPKISPRENGTVGGFFGLLLIELSKVMNFTVKTLDPVEGYGSWSKEKKVWTGAIGQLVANEADIGISAFAMTTGRRNVIDYTIPLIRSSNRLYFKEPKRALVEWSLYFRHVKDPVFVQMYELLEKKHLPLSTKEGFKQLCERNKLALYAAGVFKELNVIPCRVVYIETGRIVNLAITLTKGNPYTGLMNYHLRRFQLNGVISKLKNKFLIKDNPREELYGGVELNDVTPALTMLAGSMVLALLILIIEKVYYSSKTRSKNNNPSRKLGKPQGNIRSK
ncbi:uncharacterized protein LOC143901406 isoform X4 [Temnothorax americanus]|uniref:uncharacterized protein LOC143901406 isoform X4 n=1 Tax=Temnothorax americanus TaxID=1964332 RepID=UPI0040676AE5